MRYDNKFITKRCVKPMRIRLLLTAYNDLELLILSNNPDFDFKAWVKEILRAYVSNGRTTRTQIPFNLTNAKMKNVMLSITLDDRKDAAIIEWLETLAKKRRSDAIKAVLYHSFEKPCLLAYFKSPATAMLEISSTGERDDTEAVDRNIPSNDQSQSSGDPHSKSSQSSENDEDDGFNIFSMSMEVVEED